ncbi:MAG: DUF4738 domain-containing protein [Prevotella sp.]
MPKNKITLFLILCAGLALVSCKKKQEDPTIIIHKAEVKKPHGTEKVGDQSRNYDFQWLGAKYKAVVVRKADTSLPVATDDEGKKYYDNQIEVKILRADGSIFFSHVFTKGDFEESLEERTKRNGVLYSLIFVKAEMSSDDYVTFTVKVSRMGALSVSKDQQLDTNDEGTEGDMGD